MYSHLKVTPPKGGNGSRPIERQIHLTVFTPVLLLLVSYVLSNQLPVTPHRADAVTSRLERLPGEIPAAVVAMSGNPDCALSLDEADDRACLVLGQNGYRHVDMIGNQMPFLDAALLLPRQFMEHIAWIPSRQSEQAPALRHGHHMIFAFPFSMC